MENTIIHSRHVAHISYLLAVAVGIEGKQAIVIHIAGHLHDIGKNGIPSAVLEKKGMLADEDWAWIRKHPEIGAQTVSRIRAFQSLEGMPETILHHHERYDGSGYPHGLRGEHIPIGARIIAVADTLSALQHDRPYRTGISFDEAVDEISRHSGSQFDPAIVAALGTARSGIRTYLWDHSQDYSHRNLDFLPLSASFALRLSDAATRNGENGILKSSICG